jgi:hypothetical protein
LLGNCSTTWVTPPALTVIILILGFNLYAIYSFMILPPWKKMEYCSLGYFLIPIYSFNKVTSQIRFRPDLMTLFWYNCLFKGLISMYKLYGDMVIVTIYALKNIYTCGINIYKHVNIWRF